jgi:hypothetical protein
MHSGNARSRELIGVSPAARRRVCPFRTRSPTSPHGAAPMRSTVALPFLASRQSPVQFRIPRHDVCHDGVERARRRSRLFLRTRRALDASVGSFCPAPCPPESLTESPPLRDHRGLDGSRPAETIGRTETGQAVGGEPARAAGAGDPHRKRRASDPGEGRHGWHHPCRGAENRGRWASFTTPLRPHESRG